jgi:RecA-family ATPase
MNFQYDTVEMLDEDMHPFPPVRNGSQGNPRTLRLIDPTKWEGLPIPQREWTVEDFIPANTVTLLTGEGSAGKSTLALQLAVARGVGKAWLTTLPKPGRTLVLSAEDDEPEMWRRLDDVRRHYGASWTDLGAVRLVDLVGEDAVLGGAMKNGRVEATALFELVTRAIADFGADLVIVDALADAFAGEENNRVQARQFIGLLKRPAKQHRCAFLALAHPSLTGLAQGTGSSGSTGWGNSVRSRINFEKAKASDGSEPDPDMRTLTVNKSNYGPAGITLTLKWQNGLYLPQTGIGSLDKMAREKQAEEKFVELLATFLQDGRHVSDKRSPSYAPTHFAKDPRANGIRKDAFEAAMMRLFAKKKIRIGHHGKLSDLRPHIEPVETATQ